MKLTLLAAVLCTGLLIGCSENTSPNGPISAANPTAKTGTAYNTPSVFDIDEVVVDAVSRQEFSVKGSITYSYSKDQSSYSFSAQPSLTVSSDPASKEISATVSTSTLDNGAYAGGAQLTKEYKLGGFEGGAMLRINFALDETVSISGIQIIVSSSSEGIEAR